MPIVKWIAAFVLCLSIAIAGFPAQAKATSPMSKVEQGRLAASSTPHGQMDCHKSSGQKPDKGCCDDMACAAKCSTVSGGPSMDMPRSDGMISWPGNQTRLIGPDDAPRTSRFPHSQERPPRLTV